MSLTSRRILFYSLIFVFLLGGTGLALYAQGLRFDFALMKVDKVGAIYVHSMPEDANIFLNGKPTKNKTGLLQRGTLVSNLFPQKYTLRLSKDGYKDWTETLDVKPALVTEAKYAVLVSENSTVVSASSSKNFWLLSDRMLLQNESGGLTLSGSKLPGSTVLGITADENHLLTSDAAVGTYFWNDLQNATSVNITPALRKISPRLSGLTLAIDPENTTRVIAYTSTTLALVDTATLQITSIGSSTIPSATGYSIGSVAASRSWIAWSLYDKKDNVSQIYFYDKFFGGVRAVGAPFAGKTVMLAWANNDAMGFAQDDGEFYVYTPGTSAPQHIASDVTNFLFTPSANRVVTIGHRDLEIFTLNDAEEYWRIHLPQPQGITNLSWYKDDAHLFLSYPDATKFLEITDKNLENYETIANTDKVAYDRDANQFFYLENGALQRIDFPQ